MIVNSHGSSLVRIKLLMRFLADSETADFDRRLLNKDAL